MIKKFANWITYLLLYLLLIFAALFYRQTLFLFLLMLLAFLPVASFFACKYAFQKLSVSCQSEKVFGNAKDSFSVSVKVNNPTFFPLVHIQTDYQISSPFYPSDRERVLICPAFSKNTFSFDLPLTFYRSGAYQLTATKISCNDYLHLFTFKRDIFAKAEVMIYPSYHEMESLEEASLKEGFDEFEESEKKGTVSSNVTDVREYIPGDRLQKIHWKLSAKIDKLMVKENEQTSTNQFSLLLELFQPTPDSDCLEKSLENLFSAATTFLKKGQSFFFIYFNEQIHDFVKTYIQNEAEFYACVQACYYQKTYDTPDLALITYQNATYQSGILFHVSHKGVTDVFA